MWMRLATYTLFAVLPQNVQAGAASDSFMAGSLQTVAAGEDVATLYCACLAKNIDETIPGEDERKAAYIVIDPGMSKAEMRDYGQWLAQLPPEKQAAMAAAQNFTSGLISTCLVAAGTGKVKPDGSIVD
jgi:hypothetical protein